LPAACILQQDGMMASLKCLIFLSYLNQGGGVGGF